MPLLFLVCLLGGSSPTRAISFLNSGYTCPTTLVADDNGNYKSCYFEMKMVYFDATWYKNCYWLEAPTIYVDDVMVGKASILVFNNGDKARAAISEELWWGDPLDKTSDGVKYRVRFRDPFQSQNWYQHDKYSCYMRVYIGSMEAGSNHEVRIAGKWVYEEDTANPILIDKTWSFKAPTFWLDNYTLTADMTDYQNLKLDGQLNYNYGPTIVGFANTKSCVAPTVSSKFRSHSFMETGSLKSAKSYDSHNSSYSGQASSYTRSAQEHKDGSKVGVEYVCSAEDNEFTTYFYKWFNVDVPGFAPGLYVLCRRHHLHAWRKCDRDRRER